jgi:hypothetical protein
MARYMVILGIAGVTGPKRTVEATPTILASSKPLTGRTPKIPPSMPDIANASATIPEVILLKTSKVSAEIESLGVISFVFLSALRAGRTYLFWIFLLRC